MDGASWPVMDPLLSAGDLPAVAQLLSGGCRAVLPSVQPPLTGPAWQSIFTGCEPGEHGVFEMTVFDRDLGRRRPICASDWRAKPLWRIVDELGLSGGYLGVPFTYPPPEVRGWFVSGILGTPEYAASMFQPPELFHEVARVAGECPLEALDKRGESYPTERLNRQIDWVEAATLHLLRTRPTDVLVVVESYTDFVQHFFAAPPGHGPRERPPEMVRLAFQAADRLVGAIRREVGPETPVVLVSDHGFARLSGLINATHVAALVSGRGAARERTSEAAFRALKKLWRATGKVVLTALRMDPQRMSQWGVRALGKSGDAATDVVVGHYGSIWLTGDPAAVDDDAVERARAALAALTDPETGGPLLDVRPGSECYAGSRMDQAPHLVARSTTPHREFRRGHPASPLVVPVEQAAHAGMDRAATEGTHATEGIWAASATAAHVSPPSRLSGVLGVLKTLLPHTGDQGPPSEDDARRQPQSAYTPEQEREILKRLSDLGYLD